MKFVIIPNWRTSTHRPIFDKLVCDLRGDKLQLNFRSMFSLSRIFQYAHISLVVSWRILCRHLRGHDFRHVKYGGIVFGHSINESSIQVSTYGKATLLPIIKFVFIAAIYYVELRRLFTQNSVRLVIGGDEAYVDLSITCQLGQHHGIPVLLIKGYTEIYWVHYNKKYLAQGFLWEKADIDAVPSAEEIRKAHKLLEAGYKGDACYLPFMPRNNSKPSEPSISTPGFWIYLHDFYDSPGIYGGNLFADHLTWVCETVDELLIYEDFVYLKTHPNARSGNERIYDLLQEKYKHKVVLIYEKVSLEFLRKNTICKAIITVFGSVIPEALYAGIPVVVAGRSPYTSVGMLKEPASKTEYFDTLRNLPRVFLSEKQMVAQKLATIVKAKEVNPKLRIPFHDFDHESWVAAELGVYPDTIHQRRAVYLQNKKVEKFIIKRLSNIDLKQALKLLN